MKKLAVIVNVGKPRARDVLGMLCDMAETFGLELRADAEAAGLEPRLPVVDDADLFEGVDAVIAMGGDGTMLRAVRSLAGRDLPVIGVNIGSLGFLTSVAEEDLGRALECLVREEFTMSRRAVVEAVVLRGDRELERYRALNDVVVTSGASARVITLKVMIDDDHVTSYVCDGLIVSTPTGSTGHNMSAGGPILVPETRALVISLICPHALSSRPVVVPEDSEITLVGEGSPEAGLQLAIDGQVGRTLAEDERVKVTAADRRVRFIHLPGYSYFSVLSQKLGWKGSSVR